MNYRANYISGLKLPVLVFLSFLGMLLMITVPLNFYKFNLQGLALFIYYMPVIVALLYFTIRNNFISPIFIFFSLSVVLGLPREYKFLLEPTINHRDYFLDASIDSAVVKMYLINLSSFFFICYVYSLFPKELGFNLTRFNIKNKSRLDRASMVLFVLLCLVFVDFIYRSGSFFQAISQRALSGENRVSYEIGAYHSFILKHGYLIPLVWFIVSNKVIKNPVFWCVLSVTVLMGFLVTGSRSGLLNILVVFGFAIVLITKKFNFKKVLFAMFVIILVASYQTANRFAKADDIANYSMLDVLKTSVEGVSHTFEDAETRGIEGNSSVGLFMNLGRKLDYQLGYTYVSILFIPIPSSFLPFDKPPAAGYYYVHSLTNRTDTAWPVSGVAEAFWNFSYFGVIFYSLVMGMAFKVARNTLLKNEFSPLSIIVFLSIVFRFSLSSDGMYGFVQNLFSSLFVFFFLYLFSKFKFTFGKGKLG